MNVQSILSVTPQTMTPRHRTIIETVERAACIQDILDILIGFLGQPLYEETPATPTRYVQRFAVYEKVPVPDIVFRGHVWVFPDHLIIPTPDHALTFSPSSTFERIASTRMGSNPRYAQARYPYAPGKYAYFTRQEDGDGLVRYLLSVV